MKYVCFLLLAGSNFSTARGLAVCSVLYIAAASAHTEDDTHQENRTKAAYQVKGLALSSL